MRQKQSIYIYNCIKGWITFIAFIMPNLYFVALLFSDDNSDIFSLELFLVKIGILTIFYIEYHMIRMIRIPYHILRIFVRITRKIIKED